MARNEMGDCRVWGTTVCTTRFCLPETMKEGGKASGKVVQQQKRTLVVWVSSVPTKIGGSRWVQAEVNLLGDTRVVGPACNSQVPMQCRLPDVNRPLMEQELVASVQAQRNARGPTRLFN